MRKKIYLGFLSSEFNKLREQRKEAIDALLNANVMPIGMEYFTTSYDENFADIKRFIDECDFFILLMSDSYGTPDENGISWTEREFDYAVSCNKKIIALILPELAEAVKNKELIASFDARQLQFYDKVNKNGFAREVNNDFTIRVILGQFFSRRGLYMDCLGWERVLSDDTIEKQHIEWRADNKRFDVGGLWYHLHLSETDKKYIRVGTVNITQDFSPDKFRLLTFSGKNYDILYYDTEKHGFVCDYGKHSEFEGDYTLYDDGKILGIFNTKRNSKSTFDNKLMTEGRRRGIHEFKIDANNTSRLDGTFNNEAPSSKRGEIYLFRTEADRDRYLFEMRTRIVSRLCRKNKHKLPKDFKI